MKILLVDNGSLEPAVVLALRELAARLAAKIGNAAPRSFSRGSLALPQPLVIYPVSLAHSDKIPAAQLGGDRCRASAGIEAARCIEPFLREEIGRGKREFVILPLFIGPSRAVTQALPRLVDSLRGEFPDLRVRTAPALHAAGDTALAQILADRVRKVLSEIGKTEGQMETVKRVRVALVDHGSPVPEVTAVRDQVTARLAALLGGEGKVTEVAACSMERRPGAAYAFNEPLLETLLGREEWRSGTVVLAQLFLFPGRHAGPGGDIAQLCARAKERSPNLHTVQTEPLATHPLLVELLAERLTDILAPTQE